MAGIRFSLIIAALIPLASLAQFGGVPMAPVPSDPLELATGAIQVVSTPEDRAALIRLLNHARNNYLLRSASTGYDLKVSFTAISGGATLFDGNWQLEETFVPKLGTRWTASTGAYHTTQIRANELSYGDAPSGSYPLVLHEARGSLLGPMPSVTYTRRTLIRSTIGTLNGVQLTCVLVSNAANSQTESQGRNWDETEECINPSGLLVIHSLAPGRYALYDYSNGRQFHGHTFPQKVTITEGGNTVLEVHVDSLEDLPSADPSLFEPTPEMKAKGPATEQSGALKIPAFPKHGPMIMTPGSILQPVVVFGMLAPSGEILEAHSLQPSSPNSQAAVEAAKSLNLHFATAPGAAPQEHFVFVIERFAPSSQ